MPKNQLSPATFLDFHKMFPDENAAIKYFAVWRWPDGFICPICQSKRCSRIKTRSLWQCLDCDHQASVTAGTVMHRTKVPLLLWLYALWSIGRRKAGISALQFQRETGIRTYRTAWTLLHKVRRVLDESVEYQLECGKVEVDVSMVEGAGEKSGRMGRRLGDGDAWLVAAVERIEQERGEKTISVSGSARLEVIQQTNKETLEAFVKETTKIGSTVVTDGLNGYKGLKDLAMTTKHIFKAPSR